MYEIEIYSNTNSIKQEATKKVWGTNVVMWQGEFFDVRGTFERARLYKDGVIIQDIALSAVRNMHKNETLVITFREKDNV